MRVIEPFTVTEAMMLSSNVAETDYAAWAAGTTYANAVRVIRSHGIYESVQGSNTGHDPLTDTANAWWVYIGATNRWRAFDSRLGGVTSNAGTVQYSLSLPRTLNAMAFFGINANSLRVQVVTPGPVTIYDQTFDLASRDDVGNLWEYVNNPFAFRVSIVLTDVPLPSGATVNITVTSTGAAQVGEIILGNDIAIGKTLVDTSLGIVDYSKKERDEWGGIFIVPRPVTDTVTYRFSIPTEGASRVQQIIRRITAKTCVFYAVQGEDQFGTTVAGILRDYDLTLGTTRSYGSLQVESLV